MTEHFSRSILLIFEIIVHFVRLNPHYVLHLLFMLSDTVRPIRLHIKYFNLIKFKDCEKFMPI